MSQFQLSKVFSGSDANPQAGQERMLLNGRGGFFGERNLGILLACATLLLQSISFITTLQGSTLFLAGIFALAPLFFSLAVQATAWFLSSSLRTRITPIRCIALVLALCCSTYYSYVGIYNNVNPPSVYLAAEYATVRTELQSIQADATNNAFSAARSAVTQMVSGLRSSHNQLTSRSANLAACADGLAAVSNTYASGMRAPSRSAYANYEDYVAAYNAYIAGISSGSAAEQNTARTEILTRYGFADEGELATASADAAAALATLEAGIAALVAEGDDTTAKLALLETHLLATISAAATGEALTPAQKAEWDSFVALADANDSHTQLLTQLEAGATLSGAPLMQTFGALSATLPNGVTKASAADMKILMSGEILNGILQLNTLLPATEQIALDAPAYQITDLHLKPINALVDTTTRGMALFCLFLAALMDSLTLLFSIAYRREATLLKSRNIRQVYADNGQRLAAQICACLPSGKDSLEELNAFLALFRANPETMQHGYSLIANRPDLVRYERLLALLGQTQLASFSTNEFGEETVLLKTNFLLFADEFCIAQMRQKIEFTTANPLSQPS